MIHGKCISLGFGLRGWDIEIVGCTVHVVNDKPNKPGSRSYLAKQDLLKLGLC